MVNYHGTTSKVIRVGGQRMRVLRRSPLDNSTPPKSKQPNKSADQLTIASPLTKLPDIISSMRRLRNTTAQPSEISLLGKMLDQIPPDMTTKQKTTKLPISKTEIYPKNMHRMGHRAAHHRQVRSRQHGQDRPHYQRRPVRLA